MESIVLSPVSKEVVWEGAFFFISDQKTADLTDGMENMICVPRG